jgi:hypothetical protein
MMMNATDRSAVWERGSVAAWEVGTVVGRAYGGAGRALLAAVAAVALTVLTTGCATSKVRSLTLSEVSGYTGLVFPDGCRLRRSMLYRDPGGVRLWADIAVPQSRVRKLAANPVPGNKLKLSATYRFSDSAGTNAPSWWPRGAQGDGGQATVGTNDYLEALIRKEADGSSVLYVYYATD